MCACARGLFVWLIVFAVVLMLFLDCSCLVCLVFFLCCIFICIALLLFFAVVCFLLLVVVVLVVSLLCCVWGLLLWGFFFGGGVGGVWVGWGRDRGSLFEAGALKRATAHGAIKQ